MLMSTVVAAKLSHVLRGKLKLPDPEPDSAAKTSKQWYTQHQVIYSCLLEVDWLRQVLMWLQQQLVMYPP